MSKCLYIALMVSALFAPQCPVSAQTAEQVNSLLKKSKLVDTGRMVNTVFGADKTIISTYCNPRSSDQDCKVTALLMMKELKQHYKAIHRIQVLFYDPRNSRQYRDVEIREGDALLVDQGKPISVVLSEIDVGHHSSAQPPSSVPFRFSHSQSLTLANRSVQSSPNSNATELQAFTSKDGEMTVQYPRNWTTGASDGDFVMLSLTLQTTRGSGAIVIYRHPGFGATIESLAETHTAETQTKTKNFRLIARRVQSCNGLPAIYVESVAQYANGAEGTERAGWVKGKDHLYLVDMVSYGLNNRDIDRVFQSVFSSLRV